MAKGKCLEDKQLFVEVLGKKNWNTNHLSRKRYRIDEDVEKSVLKIKYDVFKINDERESRSHDEVLKLEWKSLQKLNRINIGIVKIWKTISITKIFSKIESSDVAGIWTRSSPV